MRTYKTFIICWLVIISIAIFTGIYSYLNYKVKMFHVKQSQQIEIMIDKYSDLW